MGKGNRVRQSKAEETARRESAFDSQKKKKQTPAWVGTLVIVLVIALLAGCIALSVISDGGVKLRSTKIASSEHFSVNGAMLSYLFYANYSQFMSTYGSYASMLGLETGTSLKNQTAMGGDGTWFDYFMEPALEQVKEMLVYCEEAKVRGIKLEDEDNKAIDDALASLDSAAASVGYSTKRYITAMYGVGVRKSDIRDVLEMIQLYIKCQNTVGEDTEAAVTDADITTYYDANPASFLTADLLGYTFNAELDGTDNDKFTADKATADQKAAALAACTTDDEFIDFVCNYVAEKNFDDYYKKNAEKYSADKLPDEATLATKRTEVIAAAIDNAKNAVTPEKTDSEETADIIFSDIESSLTEDVKMALSDAKKNDWAYDDDDDECKWISDSTRVAGETKTFTNDASEDGSYSVTVYRMVTPMHRDETLSRNVAHILVSFDSFEDKTEAKAKADEILAKFKAGTISRDAFEKLAEEYNDDSGVVYEDVVPGQMVSGFEDWLFDDARAENDAEVVESQYGYHVMYYLGKNEDKPAWKITAINGVVNEKLTALVDEKAKTYNVTVNAEKANVVNA